MNQKLPDDGFLSIPPPEDHFERIKHLARALAYGAVHDIWAPKFTVYRGSDEDEETKTEIFFDDLSSLGRPSYKQALKSYLHDMWKNRHPRIMFLEAFDYVRWPDQTQREYPIYMVSPKAFALLETPFKSKVFISYRRAESSAFALLLHDRLRADGFEPFIDMQDIEYGEEWFKRIKREITEDADVFVCLVGETTLDSPNVQDEIRWATEREGLTTIAILHNSYEDNEGTDPELKSFVSDKQAITVFNEHVLDYERAITQLMQRLKIPE